MAQKDPALEASDNATATILSAPYPWPWPWHPAHSNVSSRAETLKMQLVDGPKKSTLENCRLLASKALRPYGEKLPKCKTFELYLILALSEITIRGKKQFVVPYEPEFLFLMDCQLEALIGVSVTWSTGGLGYGDPNFPNFKGAMLRSARSRDTRRLIFPDVAGSLIIGLKPDVSPITAKKELENIGLKNVELFDFFATALCQPFAERSICAKIERSVRFVKYAEPSSIVRFVDFSPGWTIQRLS